VKFTIMLVCVAGCMLLEGCSMASKAWSWGKEAVFSPVSLREVSIEAESDTNSGYPVAVDVVVVKSAQVMETLGRLKASEWFASKSDYIRQYSSALYVMSWEVVADQKYQGIKLPEEARPAVGALIFADYPGTQSFRSSTSLKAKARIRLRQTDFELISE